MDSGKIKAVFIAILVAFAGLYLGIAVVTAKFEALAWVFGGLGLVICISLGKRIWLIIPFMSALGIALPLPGNLPINLISYVVAVSFLMLLFLVRRLPLDFRVNELEGWCFLFLLFVGQAYLRNPVGLNIFGGSSVGGKPYVILAFTAFTMLFISKLKIDPKDLKWWVGLTMLGSVMNFGLGVLGKLVPSLGMYLGATFASDFGQSGEGSMNAGPAEGQATRSAFVRTISQNLSTYIASRISVIKGIFHPIWAPLILFSLVAALYSGYRSQVVMVGLSYFVGLCYRGGLPKIFLAMFLGALGLGALAVVNLMTPLPPNVQRALTFLPGTWEERYEKDAEGSTEWRVVMWKEALTSDKYIRNKWLGDGLGFTSDQLSRMLALKDQKGGGDGVLDAHQESAMIAGDYHSGPVMTIRTVGYIGLLVLLIGWIRVAIRAHRQIQRSRGSEWFTTVLFICIPIIWGPFSWTVIFGSFTGGATNLLLGTAMVRLMENNLPLPAWQKGRRAGAYQPMVQRMSEDQGISAPGVANRVR